MLSKKHAISLMALFGLGTVGSVVAHPHVSHADTITTSQVQVMPSSNRYTVKAGDTLWGIAQQHHTSVAQLQQLNHLNNDIIYVGQQLQLNQATNYVKTVSHNNYLNDNGVVITQHQSQSTTVPAAPAQSTTKPAVQSSTSRSTVQSSPATAQSGKSAQQSRPVMTSAPVSHVAPVKPVTVAQPHVAPQPVSYHHVTAQPTANNNANGNNGYCAAAHSAAADAIAQAESGGNYNARNGQYIGKFQLSASYLHGDYSPANQDRCFVNYCNSRYGSVQNALAFRQVHGWY